MKKLKYKGLIKIESMPYLKQGVKGKKTPKYARGGGNGSFVCCEPSQLLLALETEKGKIIYADIISVVRKVNEWKCINSKRLEKLRKRLEEEGVFYISDGEILDLKKIVKV